MGIATETAIVVVTRTAIARMTGTKMAKEVGGTEATTIGTRTTTLRTPMTKTATVIARGAGATGETMRTSMRRDQGTRISTTIDLIESESERPRCKSEWGAVCVELFTIPWRSGNMLARVHAVYHFVFCKTGGMFLNLGLDKPVAVSLFASLSAILAFTSSVNG